MKQMFLLILLTIEVPFAFSEDSDLRPIATTGSEKDLSVGWNKIVLRTELGDTVSIDTCDQTGEIIEFRVDGKLNFNVGPSVLHRVRYPDFRTLRHVWYDHQLQKVNLIEFEFIQLVVGESSVNGRYKAIIYFSEKEIDVDLRAFNMRNGAWEALKGTQ